ncbi:MAG: hypothetical protein WAM30_13055 [Candidatus Dormiibacterota bacterium]
MSHQVQTQVVTIAVIVVVVAFVMVRRMRAQVVRPNAILIRSFILMALLVASLASTGRSFLTDTLALAVAPVALVVGGLLGWVIVRAMTFWTDQQTGQLWMKGGILFIIVYLAAFGLRMAAGFLNGTYSGGVVSVHATWVTALSTDLVFLSLGLWAVRGGLIYWRYRQHTTQGGVAAGGPTRF